MVNNFVLKGTPEEVMNDLQEMKVLEELNNEIDEDNPDWAEEPMLEDRVGEDGLPSYE
jgi:hypothetical protein